MRAKVKMLEHTIVQMGDPRRRIVNAETVKTITDFEEDKESASNMIAGTSRMRALRR